MSSVEHLTPEQIALYVGAHGQSAELAAYIEHVESCEDCRRGVAAAIRAGPQEPRPPADDELVVGSRIGRYVVCLARGSGAMGHVYEARDPELDRTVALKVVRHLDDSSAERALREGRALARLSHPNVVTVFDVGTWSGGVFLAMELVAGATLREWSRTPRSWREIVQVFTGVARGLAAAHRAGLVHRDIKPENLIVGDDGRARLIDFGLAIADRSSRPEIAGTPRYMAPELLGGAHADTRSDQYALAVSLYETLEGRRPAPSPTFSRRLPRWLRIAVTRALGPEDQRFVDLEAFARTLDRGFTRRRRIVVTVAAAALVAVVMVRLATHARAESPCAGAGSELAVIWNRHRAQAIAQAFVATGSHHAAATAGLVDAALADHVARWSAMRLDACEATRVRGEQSEPLLDRRAHCLAPRGAELETLVAVFERADAATVDRAVELVVRLSSIAACANSAELPAPLAPTAGPGTRAVSDALASSIARAKILGEAAHADEARALLADCVVRARAYHDLPAEAESRYLAGSLARRSGDSARALSELRQAALQADSGGDDRGKALIQIELVELYAGEASHDRATEAARSAAATIARLGHDPELVARLETRLVAMYAADRSLDAARAHYAAAAAAVQAIGDGEPAAGTFDLASAEAALAALLVEQRRFSDAEPHARHVLATDERMLGPEHPGLTRDLAILATCLRGLDHTDEADALDARARRLASPARPR